MISERRLTIERGRRLRPSRESLRRLRERARRLHEHGGDDERLRLYAERWWVWIHAGLGEGHASMASRKGGLKRHRREVLRYLQYRRSRDRGRRSRDGLDDAPRNVEMGNVAGSSFVSSSFASAVGLSGDAARGRRGEPKNTQACRERGQS